MKGRKRIYEQRVQKNITIESWMVGILDDAKKFGTNPSDFMHLGIVTMFKAQDKLPLAVIRSFIEYIKPHVIEMNEILEYYENLEKTLSNLPEKEQTNSIEPRPRSQSWINEFSIVKLIGAEDIFLLRTVEYQKDPSLFELLDDNTEIDCTRLPRLHSIDAVFKTYRPITTEKTVEGVTCPEK